MQSPAAWMTKLKLRELHQLAVRLGAPCSGPKAALIRGIQNTLTNLPHIKKDGRSQQQGGPPKLSLLSIDMGIRNLGYSHWTAELASPTSDGQVQYTKPILRAWRKINISTTPATGSHAIDADHVSEVDVGNVADTNGVVPKESFEPVDYAERAYDFIENVLAEHKPTNVLIERQRFRSGGNSAVQEWTIRVGVFEGMLYAVLKSFSARSYEHSNLLVEPVLPTRVNRFWLEDQLGDALHSLTSSPTRKTAKETKKAKIELVKTLLQNANNRPEDSLFTIDKSMGSFASAFMQKGTKSGKPRRKSGIKAHDYESVSLGASKLDDLADSFLQGLAWIQWQNNRLEFARADQAGLDVLHLLRQ